MSRRQSLIGSQALARLIRRSRLLDPALKRHWLQVLPYLAEADRARLAEILATATDPTPLSVSGPSKSGARREGTSSAPSRRSGRDGDSSAD